MRKEYVVALISAMATVVTSTIGVVSQVIQHDGDGATSDKASAVDCAAELTSLADLTTKYPRAAQLVADGTVALAGHPGCTPPRVVVIALTTSVSTVASTTVTTQP